MKVGLDAYTIRELKLTPIETLEFAFDFGFDGVQFESVSTLCGEALNKEELLHLKNRAGQMGLYIYVSIDCCNPLLYDGTRDELIGLLTRQIEAASYAGFVEIRSQMGLLKNRKANPGNWCQNLKASEEILAELAPVLKSYKCRINLETHSDSTSKEIIRIVEKIGSDIIGVTFDTGNVLLHGEDPTEVAKRVAPYTHLTHAKDVMVFEHELGYIRQVCAPGRGIIPWENLLEILYKHNPDICLSIEDHKNLFIVPVFEKDWYEDHPDVSAFEIAQILKKAREFTRKQVQGEIVHYSEYEKIPYLEQMYERLGFGLNYMKSIVKKLRFYTL